MEIEGRRARAPRDDRGPGDLREQPPEPPGHAGDHAARCRRGGATGWRRPWRRSSSSAHFNRSEFSRKAWFTNSLNYYLASTSSSTRFRCRSARPARGRRCATSARSLADGYSVLIFPEGKRNAEGEMSAVPAGRRHDRRPARRAGRARSGSRASTRCSTRRWKWPKRGPVRVAFGAPMQLTGDDYAALAQQVEDAVRRLCQALGTIGPLGTARRWTASAGALSLGPMPRAPGQPSAMLVRLKGQRI